MKSVVLIGDSIRMGYQETVIKELDGKAEVWGPEENGGTSRNVLQHLEQWIISRKPDIIHLNCGLHDLKREPDSADTFITIKEYKENLNKIFNAVKNSLDAVLIFALTTPVDEKNHHKNKPFDRFEADVDLFNKEALHIAEKYGIPVNNLFTAIEDKGKESYLTSDGVHFTDEGYKVLGKTIAQFLSAYLGEE